MADGIPKYVTVRNALRFHIQNMQEGGQLPSESELCEQYGVSRITVRRAIEDLIRDGLLIRTQGKGTFKTDGSSSSSEIINGHIRGFYRQQRDLGRTVRTRVLANRIIHDKNIARRLAINEEAEIIKLERLRYVDDTLQQYVTTYLPAKPFSGMVDHDFSDGSLYEFIETNYGVQLVENEVIVRIEALNKRVAALFGVPERTLILAMDSTVLAPGGTTVAYGVALNNTDHNEIKFIVNR
ncbi:MAG: GntR family transcriptional regulator [Bifidobacterium sp.]|uniref:GntR family transcriptional regulator n=1 Tax=Bifidobacterium sp. TaxID=41200 RepID=UPI0039EAB831